MYERCDLITENARLLNCTSLRSELITTNLNQIVELIVRHIYRVSHEFYLLDRGTFFFKLGHDNK